VCCSVEDAAQATESIEPTKKPFLNNCRCATASSSLSVARRAIPDSVEEHRSLSFIAFGGPQVKAGLSPGWAS
jgi:hypothetical protein